MNSNKDQNILSSNTSNSLSEGISNLNKKEMKIKEKEILNLFCKDKTKINDKDECNWTPLYRTVIAGDLQASEILLNNGADPNIQCSMGETPLYEAVDMEKINHVKLLLKHGANPNISQIDGLTPLHLAVKRQNLFIVKVLLKYKANPNQVSTLYKQSPVHLAIKNSVDSMILLILVNAGGSLILEDKFNKKPIDYINSEDIKRIVSMIKFENCEKYNFFTDKKTKTPLKSIKLVMSSVESKTIKSESIKKKLTYNNDIISLKNILNMKYNYFFDKRDKVRKQLFKLYKNIDNEEKSNDINNNINTKEINTNKSKSVLLLDKTKNKDNDVNNLCPIKSGNSTIQEESVSNRSSSRFKSQVLNLNEKNNKNNNFILYTSPIRNIINKNNNEPNTFFIKKVNAIRNSKKEKDFEFKTPKEIISESKKDDKNLTYKSLKIINKVHNSRNADISKLFRSLNSTLSFGIKNINDTQEEISKYPIEKNNVENKTYIRPKLIINNFKKISIQQRTNNNKVFKKQNGYSKKNLFNSSLRSIAPKRPSMNKIPFNKNNIDKYYLFSSNIFQNVSDNKENTSGNLTHSSFYNNLYASSSTCSTQRTLCDSFRGQKAVQKIINTDISLQTKYERLPIYKWLKEIKLLSYLPLFLSKKIYSFQQIIDKLKEKLITITPNDIRKIGIKIPGHIYRIFVKLEIDSELIDKKIKDFVLLNKLEKDEIDFDQSENSSAYSCCGVCSVKRRNRSVLRNNPIEIESDNTIMFDLDEWLNKMSMQRYKTNFIKSGFNIFEYVILQMFSSSPLDENIIKYDMGIDDNSDIDLMILQLNKDVKNIIHRTNNKRSSSVEIGTKFSNKMKINLQKSNNNMNEINSSNCFIY